MAQKEATLLAIQNKKGTKTYYFFADALGMVHPTLEKGGANVTDFAEFPHPKTGRIPSGVKVGGLVTVSYKTEAERIKAREDKRAKKKLFIKKIQDSLWHKVEQGKIPKAILEKIAVKQAKNISRIAKKKAKEEMLSKAKALREQAKSL